MGNFVGLGLDSLGRSIVTLSPETRFTIYFLFLFTLILIWVLTSLEHTKFFKDKKKLVAIISLSLAFLLSQSLLTLFGRKIQLIVGFFESLGVVFFGILFIVILIFVIKLFAKNAHLTKAKFLLNSLFLTIIFTVLNILSTYFTKTVTSSLDQSEFKSMLIFIDNILPVMVIISGLIFIFSLITYLASDPKKRGNISGNLKNSFPFFNSKSKSGSKKLNKKSKKLNNKIIELDDHFKNLSLLYGTLVSEANVLKGFIDKDNFNWDEFRSSLKQFESIFRTLFEELLSIKKSLDKNSRFETLRKDLKDSNQILETAISSLEIFSESFSSNLDKLSSNSDKNSLVYFFNKIIIANLNTLGLNLKNLTKNFDEFRKIEEKVLEEIGNNDEFDTFIENAKNFFNCQIFNENNSLNPSDDNYEISDKDFTDFHRLFYLFFSDLKKFGEEESLNNELLNYLIGTSGVNLLIQYLNNFKYVKFDLIDLIEEIKDKSFENETQKKRFFYIVNKFLHELANKTSN